MKSRVPGLGFVKNTPEKGLKPRLCGEGATDSFHRSAQSVEKLAKPMAKAYCHKSISSRP
jgi:hypothetical protein